MSTLFKCSLLSVVLVVVLTSLAIVSAHEMTVKGTVAGIEAKRIQVKTGEEKTGEAAAWYAIDAKTKIIRDKTTVTPEDAKVKAGERVVVIVNHDANGKMTALEIRLAAR
jgi:hypothetical protein